MNLADVKRVGVVGAGTMGHGIAINFALAGYPVLISDVSEEVLDEAKARIRSALDLFVEERLVSRRRADEAMSLIPARAWMISPRGATSSPRRSSTAPRTSEPCSTTWTVSARSKRSSRAIRPASC